MNFKTIIVVGLLLFCTLYVYSHPHLFIKPSIEIIVENESLQGIKITWAWDQWWSMDVLNYCDSNQDGSFNKEETDLVFKDYFSGIKDFGYFTQISIDGKRYHINRILEFAVTVDGDEIVTYAFFIPIEVATVKGSSVKICFNDETIYTAFDQKLEIINRENVQLTDIKIEDFSYYGVQVRFTIE